MAPWNSLLFNWKGPIKSPLFANVGSKKTLGYLLKEFNIVQKELQQQQLLVVDQVVVVVHVVVIMIIIILCVAVFLFSVWSCLSAVGRLRFYVDLTSNFQVEICPEKIDVKNFRST